MALDFSKFGTPVESSSALDFSKFGTPVEPSSTPDFSKFGTPVGGAPDTIEKIRQEATDARKQWQQTGLAPSTTAPVEGTGGAAFGVFAAQGKQRQQNIEARKEQQKALEIPYQELITRDDYLDVINKGMKAVGERPFDPAKETRKEFVDRAYTNRRLTEYNNVFGLVPELIAIKNSGADKANQIAQFRQLYSEAEDNPNKLKAGLDIAYAVLTDASTYLGFGFGKAASSIVARTGVKSLAEEATTRAAQKTALGKRAKLAEVGVSAGTESAIGGASYATQLRLDQETARQQGKEVPEFNEAGAIMATLLPGVVSGAVSAKLTKAPTIKERGEIINEYADPDKLKGGVSKFFRTRNITPDNPTAPPTPAEQSISKALSKDFEDVHSQYVKAHGKSLLNQIDPAMDVTDSKVKEAYSRTAVRFALNVMKDNPEQFGFNPAKELVSDAIYRTLSQVDKIDDATLESAINKAGLRPDQFAAMTKTTASEAGQILQAYSATAKVLKRMREVSPGFNKEMKELYGADSDQVSNISKGISAIKRGERESLAWITSGIDTLARNIYGAAIVAPLNTGVKMIEGVGYSVGRALNAAEGQRTSTLFKSMGDEFKDATNFYFYLNKANLSEDITEKLLTNNPTLLNRMSSSTQDTAIDDVSKVARWSQTLNTAIDGLQRRAAFAASVETQLRRVGIDMYKDILTKNKDVPVDILKRAVDDSFKSTFSYSPKEFAKTLSSVEDGAERFTAKTIKVIESIPFSTVAIPFARFVSNALAFQYKYSPLGFVGAAEYITQAGKFQAAGQTKKAEMAMREGFTKSIQATVGFGMIAAAYDYRKNNPDLEWGQVRFGNDIIDARSIFPIGGYLAFGEFFHRGIMGGEGTPKYAELRDAILGFKIPAGSQHTLFKTLQDWWESDEKGTVAMQGVGKIAGDLVGRFTQPFVTKQVFDMFDLLRGDEALRARDPNVLTAETGAGQIAQAAAQRVQAKLPVVKEALPPAIVRFKEQGQETPMKEGEFFNRLVGFRPITEPTAAEKEIIRHSVDLYKVYGRPTGDKDFDRLFIQNVNKNALDFVSDDIKTSEYKSLITSEQKQQRISNVIEKAVKEAKKVTEATFAQESPAKLNRIEYLREPAKVKKMVNDLYAIDHNGRTMEEDKAYDLLPEYKERAIGPTKYAKGGMVQQMHQLFGR